MRASGSGGPASPVENISLDAASDLFPGLENCGAGLDGGCSLSHDKPILRLDRPPNEAWHQTPAGAIMSRRG